MSHVVVQQCGIQIGSPVRMAAKLQSLSNEMDDLTDLLGEIHGNYIVEGCEDPENFDWNLL